MPSLYRATFSLFLLTAGACTGEGRVAPDTDGDIDTGDIDTGDTGGAETEPLVLEFSAPPITLPDGALFAADVAYDEHDQTVFDVMLPDADGPTPLVIYIHGGGFTGGDKAAIYEDEATISTVLSAGVAFATFNYRLLESPDAEGVIKPLGDSRRALQFVRYHHEALNIDPDRVVAFGGSAGAGTVLWLGSHDDMADPDAADPVERESTRLSAVGVTASQATYDLYAWEDIFAEYGLTIEDAAEIAGEERLFSFYGVSSWDEMASDAVTAYRADVDMLAWMDAGDAPVWIETNGAVAPPKDTSVLYHHPYHARAVMERAQAVGLEEVSYIPSLGVSDSSSEDMLSFFARHIGL